MNEYVISARQVSDRRLEFTWTPNPFAGAPNTFWVEYPFEVAQIEGQDVFYPVLPLFLALGFADSRFRLESPSLGQSDDGAGKSIFAQVLANWLDFVEKEAVENFGETIHVAADLEGHRVDRRVVQATRPQTTQPGVGLFFGGGAESLLTLADLMKSGTKPQLISYLGPGWIGSDPAKNDAKVAQDLRVARALGLELHHVRTNIYGLFAQMQDDLSKRMTADVFFANRVTFTPVPVALLAPMACTYKLGAVYHGHERHHEYDPTFHCFTKSFTDRLTACFSPMFAYRRVLADLKKVDAFEKLWTNHPEFLTYQYSCYDNDHERWCLACEKCLRYYILYKLYNVPFSDVGFDEARMLKNFGKLHEEIAGHVWHDVYLRSTYREIRAKARTRGDKEVCDLLSKVIREGQRVEGTKKIKAVIRPLIPKPVRKTVKGALQPPSLRTARVEERI